MPPIEEINRVQSVGNVCLLCKRIFESRNGVLCHQKESVLHSDALAKWQQEQIVILKSRYDAASTYRDRTLDRQQYDVDSASVPASVPAAEMSIGEKMLAKMGWEGGGLGKEEDGILEPITAHTGAKGSGLGSFTHHLLTQKQKK